MSLLEMMAILTNWNLRYSFVGFEPMYCFIGGEAQYFSIKRKFVSVIVAMTKQLLERAIPKLLTSKLCPGAPLFGFSGTLPAVFGGGTTHSKARCNPS